MSHADCAPDAIALSLTCQPGKTDQMLTFPYALENQGASDVYVMHALPRVDAATGDMRPDAQSAVVVLGADGDVVLGKYAAPLPADRRVALPVLPLARRLPAGGALQARLDIPLPLAETSPYFPDLTLRDYDLVEIKAVVFTIGYWLDSTDGLAATEVEHAPGLFAVVTRHTWRSARRLSRRFPATGLHILKRKDAFPRAVSAGASASA